MNNTLRVANEESGFTLIELLIVVVIIGILSSLFTANFIGVRQKGRDAQRKSDLRQVQSALELYRADQGNYPDSISCGLSLTAGSPTVTYMQKIPCDPLNSAPNIYILTSSSSTYQLVACLENSNDGQRDDNNGLINNAACVNGSKSYTLTPP